MPSLPERVELVELGAGQVVQLPSTAADALAASRVVTVERLLQGDGYLVRPGKFVGVAVVAGIEVWIRPKVPIDRLMFLLGYALSPKGWQEADVPMADQPELLPAVAAAFARQADRALREGVLHGYHEVDASLSLLRGRIRESDQLGRRFGLPIPMEVRYDEYSVDIAENQLLLSAARRLQQLPRLTRTARAALLRLVGRLDGVSPIVPGRLLPSWQPSRLNTRYHVAVRLAEMILRSTSIDPTPGARRINGFLVEMHRIFEDFVTVSLGEAIERQSGRTQRQASAWLDEAGMARMRPDLVWTTSAGIPQGVVDAKYKAEKPEGFPEADLYQLLAYCTALELPVGHLVYAKGSGETERRHVIRGSGVEIVQHVLDLTQPPRGLLGQIQRIAAAITDGQAHSLAPASDRWPGPGSGR
jgi:5-methylcytosine-specific restriction enzyme subunit McrC